MRKNYEIGKKKVIMFPNWRKKDVPKKIRGGKTEQMFERALKTSVLFIIVFFCLLIVGLAEAGSYQYILSGGPSPETPLIVDDDLEVQVNGKTVFIDNDGVSTMDGRAIWNGTPITFSASPGDVLRIVASNTGGVELELSPLYLHVNGQFLKLSDGIPRASSDMLVFYDKSFTISIQPETVDGSIAALLVGFAILIILLLVSISRKVKSGVSKPQSLKPQLSQSQRPETETAIPEPKEHAPIKPESQRSILARGRTVFASSAVNYHRTMILYKVKIENKLPKPISDVRIKAFVPSVFLIKEDEMTIAMLEQENARTVTFEIRPTGECGDCNISGKVTFYNHLIDKREEIEIPVKSVSVICPLLRARKISEEAWRTLVSSLIEAGENTKDEIPIAAKSLFSMVSDIVKDINLFKVSEDVTENASFFRGVARFYGEGVKEFKYAAQIETVGGTKRSQLILKTWSEREDALIGFYYKILDEIEKRIRIKGYIDDGIVQQVYQIGTIIRDSVVQRSTIGSEGEAGKKCSRCGNAVSDDEQFCPKCGEKLQ